MANLLDKGSFDRTESVSFQEEMIYLGMSGLSLKECGDYYGLDPKDWEDWCKEHPITELRYNCGKAKAIVLSGRELLRQIKSGKTAAVIFHLKTQGGFTEKSLLQINENIKMAEIPFPTMPTDSISAARVYEDFIKNS